MVRIFDDFEAISQLKEHKPGVESIQIADFISYLQVPTRWKKATKEQLEKIFRIFDIDFDGYLSRTDFEELATVEQIFHDADKNNSGQLSYNEFKNAWRERNPFSLVSPQIVFDDKDINKDRVLTKLEFFLACKRA